MEDKQVYRGDWYDSAYAVFSEALANIKEHNQQKILGFFSVDDARLEVEKSLAAIIDNFSFNHSLVQLNESVTNIINNFKQDGGFGFFKGKYQPDSPSKVLSELECILQKLNELDVKDQIKKKMFF